MRPALAFAAMPLAACVATPPVGAAASAPRFSALDFFDGHTEGSGTLHIVLKGAVPVRVHGRGHRDGTTLVLDQTIERAGTPSQTREWRISEDPGGRYTGTLTSARGPISGSTVGNRLHLAFRSKTGLDTQQWLTLAPDGRSARNVMIVRKRGFKVAVLDERISKID